MECLRSSQKVVGYSYSIHAAIVLMVYLASLAIIITFSIHIWVRLLIETFLYQQPEESFGLVWKLANREEFCRLERTLFLYVLSLTCVVALAMGSYSQIWVGSKEQWLQHWYLEGSKTCFTKNSRGSFSYQATGLAIWQLRASYRTFIPSATLKR